MSDISDEILADRVKQSVRDLRYAVLHARSADLIVRIDHDAIAFFLTALAEPFALPIIVMREL